MLLALLFALTLLVRLVQSSLAAGRATEIALGVPGIVWLTAPILTAALFVGASPTRARAVAFLILEGLLITSVVAELIWGGPLGLAFLPVAQACAIMLAFLIALAFGWRMRTDFLNG